MLIAIIEPEAKVVWGVGETPYAAMQDAQKEIAEKNGITPGDLVYAFLPPDAPLDLCGQGLYPYVIQEEENHV